STLVRPPVVVRSARGTPVPVVMVVFDEFRGTTLVDERNEIDGNRFPHFAELARGSTWFRNATTVHPDTQYAVPALLSGKYSRTAWLPGFEAMDQNLFTLLEATDAYEMAVFEPVSRLATSRIENEAKPKPPVVVQAFSLLPTLARVYL